MRNSTLQRMSWLHRSLGITVGWVAYFVFAIGSLGYFDTELDRWMQPELPLRPAASALPDATTSIERAMHYLHSQPLAQGAQYWAVSLPSGHMEPNLRVAWRATSPAGGMSSTGRILDYDGHEAAPARATGGGFALYRLHVQLHYLPKQLGFYIVGVAAIGVLLLTLTGILIHKRLLRDLARPGRRIRTWLDAHNALGAIAIPFLLFMTYSGLVFLNSTYLPALFDANFGVNGRARYIASAFPKHPVPAPSGMPAPLITPAQAVDLSYRHGDGGNVTAYTVWNPGDSNARIIVGRERRGLARGTEEVLLDGATGQILSSHEPARSGPKRFYDIVLGIHEGNFANAGVRALYFTAGLLGAAVIATGLGAWIRKRLPGATPGIRILHRLNTGIIGGLPTGIAAYLLANRLIPVDLASRAAWEVHALFLAWLCCIGYALCARPAGSVIGLARIAAGALLSIPLVNLLTTGRHLLVTLPAQDWGLAGVDLVAAALGILALVLSMALARTRTRKAAPSGAGRNAPDPARQVPHAHGA